MARYVWDKSKGEFVPPSEYHRPTVARSDLPCPAIVSDCMDAIQSQADGLYYDSKSAYYGGLKRAGCEIDDRPYEPTTKSYDTSGIGQDVKEAYDQVVGI